MKRSVAAIDAAFVVLGLPAAVIGWQVAEKAEGRFIAVMTTIAAVLAGMAVNHTITRAPRLIVTYANPSAGDRPVVWNGPLNQPPALLEVRVENQGWGPARAVEVEFDHLGMDVWNPTGNPANPKELDILVNPPRFTGDKRVLNPGDSPWRIASLRPTGRSQAWRAGTARWKTQADGMDEQTGEVEITLLDRPPE